MTQTSRYSIVDDTENELGFFVFDAQTGGYTDYPGFETREEAEAEIKRLTSQPWNAQENKMSTLTVSELGSASILAAYGPDAIATFILSNDLEADGRVSLYKVETGPEDEPHFAITTNADSYCFGDQSGLETQLSEWALERASEFDVPDEDESGQTSVQEHHFWLAFASDEQILSWKADLER